MNRLNSILIYLLGRIFHLNDQLSSSAKSTTVPDKIAEKVVDLIQERDLSSMHIKEKHDMDMRRISELESELTQLKVKKGINSSTSQMSSKTNSGDLAESLKRERQAAMAIAEHDASLILSLEKEDWLRPVRCCSSIKNGNYRK